MLTDQGARRALQDVRDGLDHGFLDEVPELGSGAADALAWARKSHVAL
jgi:hypothetical protein